MNVEGIKAINSAYNNNTFHIYIQRSTSPQDISHILYKHHIDEYDLIYSSSVYLKSSLFSEISKVFREYSLLSA